MLTSGDSLVLETDRATAEPDLAVLRRFAETRDPLAFKQIVERYGQVVYSASMRILGDEGRAQDVSQETFYRLMRQPQQVTLSLGGWLHRSATRLAIDARRSEYARRNRERAYSRRQFREPPDHSNWAELSPQVDRALSELEDSTRELLVRHFLQGTPQADLAVELDASPATISRRIKAGLAALQAQLENDGIDLGMSSLIFFFMRGTTRSASAAFMSEMGKMQLIAYFRPFSGVVPPAAFVGPTPYKMEVEREIFSPLKIFTAYFVMATILAAFVISTYVSWERLYPAPAVTREHVEEVHGQIHR